MLDRIALNDLLTQYLASLGWSADDEEDWDSLNDIVHMIADAVESLIGIKK